MPSDDELRRVAEDVRALARSLGRDIRTAIDRTRDDICGAAGSDGHTRRSAREDLAAAGRAAADELRAAQLAVAASARQRHQHRDDPHRDDRHRDDRHRDDRHRLRLGGPGSPGGAGRVQEKAPSPPLRHRHDGTTLIGVLALVFGLAWLTAAMHVAPVSTRVVFAIALIAVGAAMVVTARSDWALSRRTWPVVAGAAVALALLASSTSSGLPVGFRHLQFGDQAINPQSWDAVPTVIHGGFGQTTVDLSTLTALPEARTVVIDNAAGQVEIDLPTTVEVNVMAHVSGGQIQVDDTAVPASGVGQTYGQLFNPTAPPPILTLHVTAGFAQVLIRTHRPAPAPLRPEPPSVPGFR